MNNKRKGREPYSFQAFFATYLIRIVTALAAGYPTIAIQPTIGSCKYCKRASVIGCPDRKAINVKWKGFLLVCSSGGQQAYTLLKNHALPDTLLHVSSVTVTNIKTFADVRSLPAKWSIENE